MGRVHMISVGDVSEERQRLAIEESEKRRLRLKGLVEQELGKDAAWFMFFEEEDLMCAINGGQPTGFFMSIWNAANKFVEVTLLKSGGKGQ